VMKNQYGVPMNIYGSIIPGAARISHLPELSREAQARLKWFDFYASHDENARLTCRHFGISPDTFYRWKRRFNPRRLESLEDDRCSRKPKQVRKPLTDPGVVQRIRELRETYPRWGKKKLWKLLQREETFVSVSTVGRALTRLREKGQLEEPPVVVKRLQKVKRQKTRRTWAIKKPWGFVPENPGDLIEIDTVHVRLIGGLKAFQFTAQDCIAKHTVRLAASRATATSAARIIGELRSRLPYEVKAIQIDGGSEFKSVFEEECAREGIILYVLPPRSPKLNGMVERMQRTSREEVYDLGKAGISVEELNLTLIHEDDVYNMIRPHDSLSLMTPNEYYAKCLTR
jgi:putative transposase